MPELAEILTNTEDLPWIPMGDGAWGRILRTSAETGSWTILFKQAAGTFAPPHKHLAGAEFYVLSGCIEYRAGVAKAGHYGYEPLGAVHERTTFSEETVYLFTSYGPLAMYGPEGNVVGVLDVDSLRALADAEAGLSR